MNIIDNKTTIKEALGKEYRKLKILDDKQEYGGKSFEEETLGNFMDECEINENETYFKLLKICHKNGVYIE